MRTAIMGMATMLFLGLSSTGASAWYCRAVSPTGSWGWGASYNLYSAKRIALRQCAVRTPRGFTCFLQGCQ